jgi:hypothetical protein
MPAKHTSKCEDQEKEKTWGANNFIIVSPLQQAEPTNIVYHAQKKKNT